MEKVKDALVKDSKLLKLGVSYTDEGVNVKYGKASVGIVKSPYTGEYELAVKPYYKNMLGDWVEVYSFEDDIQYRECMRIMSECEFAKKPIPEDVINFARDILTKKDFARQQANAFVESQSGLKGVETGYTMNSWREDLVSSPDAVKMLEDYKAKHPTPTAAKPSGKVQ